MPSILAGGIPIYEATASHSNYPAPSNYGLLERHTLSLSLSLSPQIYMYTLDVGEISNPLQRRRLFTVLHTVNEKEIHLYIYCIQECNDPKGAVVNPGVVTYTERQLPIRSLCLSGIERAAGRIYVLAVQSHRALCQCLSPLYWGFLVTGATDDAPNLATCQREGHEQCSPRLAFVYQTG